jgi:hypothetical protein
MRISWLKYRYVDTSKSTQSSAKGKTLCPGCIAAQAGVKLESNWSSFRLTLGSSQGGTMSKSQIQVAIIILTIATALIHLILSFWFPTGPDPIFILNGLGYVGLVVLLYGPLPQLAGYRRQIRWAFLLYTAVTILLWVVIGARSAIAYIDKLIEAALFVLLWAEDQQAQKES